MDDSSASDPQPADGPALQGVSESQRRNALDSLEHANPAETEAEKRDNLPEGHEDTGSETEHGQSVSRDSGPPNDFVQVSLDDAQQTRPAEGELEGELPSRHLLILTASGDSGSHASAHDHMSNITTSRERSETLLSTISSTVGPQGQPTMSSMFFLVQALESIQSSKEGKRKGPLKDATAKALGFLDPRKFLTLRRYQITRSIVSPC